MSTSTVKGELHGLCYRTSCKNDNAIYFNHSARQHYCLECAEFINSENFKDSIRLYGHVLCTLAPSVANENLIRKIIVETVSQVEEKSESTVMPTITETMLKNCMVKYAKKKCQEQREICSNIESISFRCETLEDIAEHREDVKNADEPIFN